MSRQKSYLAAAQIVQDSGGTLVGRTRFQKIAYLMQLAGFGDDFSFEYRHYGPYSEDLANAIDIASILGPISEEERTADWGGRYSIFTLKSPLSESTEARSKFVSEAKKIDAVELELAATAAFLFAEEGIGAKAGGNPWTETARRKPTKAADGRLNRAVKAYDDLRAISSPKPLPKLPAPEFNGHS